MYYLSMLYTESNQLDFIEFVPWISKLASHRWDDSFLSYLLWQPLTSWNLGYLRLFVFKCLGEVWGRLAGHRWAVFQKNSRTILQADQPLQSLFISVTCSSAHGASQIKPGRTIYGRTHDQRPVCHGQAAEQTVNDNAP